MLLKDNKNGGGPIDDAFFRAHIAGRTNEYIFAALWPELSLDARKETWEEKEAEFRRRAASQLTRLPGLTDLLTWVNMRGVRKVAVTNAPRANAELMLRALRLENYFEARSILHWSPYDRVSAVNAVS